MSSFVFDTILSVENEDFSKGNFLWIWHADKIPPHVGISVDGIYFSLKFNGKDDGIPTEITLKIIEQKQIPSVLVELKNDISLNLVQTIFDSFEKTQSNQITCLSPIVELSEKQNIDKLSSLLFELKKSNQIGTVFGKFLPENYDRIPEYSVEEIHLRLKKLQDA